MIYIQLYLAFFNIGILSFGGGYATLPLIQEYIVNRYAWISLDTMLDIVSISQMTPGPIAINAASFVGMKVAGILGSIVATIGVITPQIIIISIFLKILGFKNNKITRILSGITVAVVALILVSSINLFHVAVINNFNILNLCIFIIGLILYYKSYNMIKLIIFSSIIGFLGVILGA